MRIPQFIPSVVVLMAVGVSLGAGVEADSPKGVMKALYEAIEAGDAAALGGILHASNEAEKHLAEAFVRQMTAAQTMAQAIKAKFNLPGDGLSKGMPAREPIARLEKAVQEIQGDKATLTIPGQARALNFVKSQGQWRVSVADFAGADAENLKVQISVLKDMGDAYDSITADVRADKFVTVQDAQRALGRKLQAVMMSTLKKNPPASQPAK